MKEEKRKWVMPKFLPHKYDVKLVSEDKVGQQTCGGVGGVCGFGFRRSEFC